MFKQCTFYSQLINEEIANTNRKNVVKRLKWATEKVGWKIEWENIIYSVKKFNMGYLLIDGWCCYWCDLGKGEKTLCKRDTGGRGVMI